MRANQTEMESDAEKPLWRAMRPGDLEEVCRIAVGVHPGLPERQEVFEEKFRLFPAGCFALEQGGSLVGYAISHPWMLFEIPPLDAFLERLPSPPDCLYLHDVALIPAARGRGAAAQLMDRLRLLASREGVGFIALASVYGTGGFWRAMGFAAASSDRLAEKLQSYGPSACYMVKKLEL
ncbi:GNAT family N-acetyltransferase [Methylocystis iwaonis]|uniref:GNAT family N-acetyltransferase n=1 Tax=Methylocystis iwaonis TaxID=2885079 RepID=UPI002E7B4DCF|nr:GNAT family N-acetyltransferase [Methylocystis iwaonis]